MTKQTDSNKENVAPEVHQEKSITPDRTVNSDDNNYLPQYNSVNRTEERKWTYYPDPGLAMAQHTELTMSFDQAAQNEDNERKVPNEQDCSHQNQNNSKSAFSPPLNDKNFVLVL